MSQGATPKWKRFEELVADIQKDLAPEGFTVTANDKIMGKESQVSRQIDVSMRGSVGQFELLMILDAKDYDAPVDIKGLEEFMGLAQDVRAQKAGMVSAKGFTQAAKNKAANASIDLYTVLDTGQHEWRSTLSLPSVCEVTDLIGYQVKFSGVPYEPFSIRMDVLMNPRAIVLFDKVGNKLGTIDEFLMSAWWGGKVEFEEGVHEDVEIVPNPVYIEDCEVEGGYCAMNLHATLHVKKFFYHGEVSLKEVRGLRNEITGRHSIIKNMTTEAIEYEQIRKDWQEVESLDQLAVQPILHLRVIGMR